MLTRLRLLAEPLLNRISRYLAVAPAWTYTVAGLLVAIVYVVLAGMGYAYWALAALLISGFLDAVDGSVARVRGEAGPRGALLDSVTDRLADTLYGLGLIVLGFNPILAYLYTALALLVSYVRARFESIACGSTLEGIGLMERGDRILALAITIALYPLSRTAAYVALIALVILTAYTAAYRFATAYRLVKA